MNAFAGAGLAQMMGGIGEGMNNALLYKIMMDREDQRLAMDEKRWNRNYDLAKSNQESMNTYRDAMMRQQAAQHQDSLGLQRDQLKQAGERFDKTYGLQENQFKVAAMASLMENVTKAYKSTGSKDVAMNVWNANAQEYGFPKITDVSQFNPSSREDFEVYSDDGGVYRVNLVSGQAAPVTDQNGQPLRVQKKNVESLLKFRDSLVKQYGEHAKIISNAMNGDDPSVQEAKQKMAEIEKDLEGIDAAIKGKATIGETAEGTSKEASSRSSSNKIRAKFIPGKGLVRQ